MNRKIVAVFGLIILSLTCFAQQSGSVFSGSISYITPQNVYVKFESTQQITIGDTLWLEPEGQKIPALVVLNKSSISCVCKKIYSSNLSVNQKVIGFVYKIKAESTNNQPLPLAKNPDSLLIKQVQKKNETKTNLFDGRISIASYITLSNVRTPIYRMRYTLFTKINALNEERISADTYLTFSHKNNQWNEIKDNIYNGLKVYSLAANYCIDKKNLLTLGRKINSKISNVGAIDGVQYQTQFSIFDAGAFFGTRPDFTHYDFNPKLFQYGAYLSHNYKNLNGAVQNTLAFVDQYYRGQIDRRYTYIQHINSLAANLYFFGSAEVDLFNKEFNTRDSSLTNSNKPRITNLYLSIRYRPFKKLSLNASYSALKNVVYYESFKPYLDQLLDAIFLQGYNLRISYHPFKKLTIGINGGYRFTKEDINPAKNSQIFINWYQIPYISGSLMLTPSIIDTEYMKGHIIAANYSRDIIPGKLYGGLGYRYLHYTFINTIVPMAQNVAELNIQYKFKHRISCSINYEGSFDNVQKLNSLYLNLTKRF